MIKGFHLRMCIRILLCFGKLPQWNRHLNGTIFEENLRSRDWPWWKCHVNGTSVFRYWLHEGFRNITASCGAIISQAFENFYYFHRHLCVVNKTQTTHYVNLTYGYILVTYVSYFLLTLMLSNLDNVRNSDAAITLTQLM